LIFSQHFLCGGTGNIAGHFRSEMTVTKTNFMTPREIKLVQDSWNYITNNVKEAGSLFYTRLFEQSPHLKPLFKSNIREQEHKLTAMITVAVSKLNNLDEITNDVKALGTRHKGYGVKDEYYNDVATALLWTLEQGLGKQWNDEVKDAWTKVYVTLAGIMSKAPAKI
jgi:hemoglobin-like flavoprotein